MRVLLALLAVGLVCLIGVTASDSAQLQHTLASWPADSVMPLLRVDPALLQTARIQAFDEPEEEAAHSLAEVSGDAEQQGQADNETETETETAVQTEQETEAAAETESSSESEVASAAAAESETEQQTESAASAAAEAAAGAVAEAAASAEAEAETEASAEAEAETEAEAAASAAVQAEGELAAEAEALASAEAETAAVTANLAAHGLDVDMLTEAEAAVDAEGYAGMSWTAMIQGAGCGSGATSYIVPDFNMRPACDAHDRCYDTCGSRQPNCDSTFYSNMKNICARKYAGTSLAKKAGRRVCDGQAFLYYQAVKRLGKGPFTRAQTKSRCPK